MDKTPTRKTSAGTQLPPRGMIGGIGDRILLLSASSLLISLAAVAFLYAGFQENAIFAQNDRSMRALTLSVQRGLEAIMLTGNAETAARFAERLKQVPGVVDFRILRPNGNQAFLDNETIYAVNRHLGRPEFAPRSKESMITFISRDMEVILSAYKEQREVTVYDEDAKGNRFLTFIAPIVPSPECIPCHGEGRAVLGAMKLVTSLAPVEKDIRMARRAVGFVVVMALAATILLTSMLARRYVVKPVRRVRKAMLGVAEGDLSLMVPVVCSDELGEMAISFNRMTAALRESHDQLRNERDKLATTILSTREGVVVTDASGEVVLVNPAAERILGKTREEIIENGFYQLLDDPEYLTAYLARSGQGMPEVFVYHNRVLKVYAATIHSRDGEVTGRAVMVRNMTELQRLEEQLQELSSADPVTGLFNRKRFDEVLENEFRLYQRYNLETGLLAVVLDNYAAVTATRDERGVRRILKAFSELLKVAFRDVDYLGRHDEAEFRVILPSTGHEGVLQAAERLRTRILEEGLDGVAFTVSIGAITSLSSPAKHAEDWRLMLIAAVAEAQRGGGNQVWLIEDHAPGHGPARR